MLLIAAEARGADEWHLHDEAVVVVPEPELVDHLTWTPARRSWRSTGPDGIPCMDEPDPRDERRLRLPPLRGQGGAQGRTRAEVDEVISWLTGFDAAELARHLAQETSFADFFAAARLNPRMSEIGGSVCGVKVQEVPDPLMRQIRCLDKLVDELAKGCPMDRILRGTSAGHGAGGLRTS